MSGEATEVRLARWSDRFFAWLIDFLIVSAVSAIVVSAAFGDLEVNWDDDGIWSEGANYIPTSLLFFAYWAILEYRTGQSVGKKLLRLRVTDTHGGLPGLKGVLVSSFGKAFLLPFDVVLGWVFTNKNRQRIFNKIGDTLVVKIPESGDVPGDVTYKKD